MPKDPDSKSVEDVLAGRKKYDELSDLEQSLVRRAWADRIEAARSNLDYAAAFERDQTRYSEADIDGELRIIEPRRD